LLNLLNASLRSSSVLALFLVLAAGASAQTYEPQRGQAGKDVMWIATPDTVVDRMLQMGELTASDRLVDLGSGDGKIPIAAARNYGARAVGLEYNPKLVDLSVQRAAQAGVADKVSLRQADIFEADFSDANVVTMYLLPELNLRLRPILFRMAPGTRVVSHSFRMGDWLPDEVARIGTAEVFAWRIPANASGTWSLSGPPGAPQALVLTQKLQQLDGMASFGALSAGITQPQMAGSAIAFNLRDGSGAMLRFAARVAGDRMTGTMTRGNGAPAAFEAVRSGAAQPIEGVVPTPQETNAAARVLNN
jgi:SAM-dependent methyltransferase